MGIGHKMFHPSFYPYSLSEKKKVRWWWMPLCVLLPHSYPSQDTTVNASFPILPWGNTGLLGFKHPSAVGRWWYSWPCKSCMVMQPKVKEWDRHLAVCIGKGVQDCCTELLYCQQCGRKTGNVCCGAWQCEHIHSSSLKRLQPLVVIKRMRTMGSAVRCRVVCRKLWVVPKCSIGTEAPSLYAKTSN